MINLGLPKTLMSLLQQTLSSPQLQRPAWHRPAPSIVGVSMTAGLVLAVLALVISVIMWAIGANSSNPRRLLALGITTNDGTRVLA